jgi:hypothetical protein
LSRLVSERVILLFDVLLPFAMCFYPIKIWVRWFQSDIKFVEPKWRSQVSLFGFVTSNISLLIIVSTMIHGLVSSRVQPDAPITAAIFATSLIAVVAALTGTGSLGFPTAVCSVFCLLVSLISAVAA